MTNPIQHEVAPEVLEQAFPWPADAPLGQPRFGSTSRQASAPLPTARDNGGGPLQPFELIWESSDLGLTVRVEEGVADQAGQLIATVLSDRSEYVGKEARVVLAGGAHDECRSLFSVELRSLQAKPTNQVNQTPPCCWGRTVLGTAAALRAKLGDGEVKSCAFLFV